jgi:pimeloyl-ACP methyl ester carboxylesterase
MKTSNPYPNSSFAVIDDVRLHIRTWPVEAPTIAGKVLLVHGLGGSTYCWEKTVPALCQAGYFVVAVDLPAFGYSSRWLGINHSQKNRARLLWKILAKVDQDLTTQKIVPLVLRETTPGEEEPAEPTPEQSNQGLAAAVLLSSPWNLVGHSMGAGTIAAMALSRPKKVGHLVFVDGALHHGPPAIASLLLRIPPFRILAVARVERLLHNEQRLRKILQKADGHIPTQEQLSAYHSPLLRNRSAAALVDMTITNRNVPTRLLRRITAPVCAIWGSNDPIVPVREIRQLRDIFPQLQVRLIKGAYHLPMETHPEEFNQALLGYLQAAAGPVTV